VTPSSAAKQVASLVAARTVEPFTGWALTSHRSGRPTVLGGPGAPLRLDRTSTWAAHLAVRDVASAASDPYYSLPATLPPRTPENRQDLALLSALKKATRGAAVYMRMQELLTDPSFLTCRDLGLEARASSQRPGESQEAWSRRYNKASRTSVEPAYHPSQLEARVAEAIRPYGLTLERLPQALREVEARLGATLNSEGRARLQRGATFWEGRAQNVNYRAAQRWPALASVVVSSDKAYQLRATPRGSGDLLLAIEGPFDAAAVEVDRHQPKLLARPAQPPAFVPTAPSARPAASSARRYTGYLLTDNPEALAVVRQAKSRLWTGASLRASERSTAANAYNSAQNTPAARAWVASGGPLQATANALRDEQAAAGGRIPDLARHLADGLMQRLKLYPEAYGRLVGEIESELRAP